MAAGKKQRQAELPNTRRRYGSGTTPDTPSALRKACARVATTDSERLLVGCALLLASRIDALEQQGARVLDVLLKRTDVEGFERAATALSTAMLKLEADARTRDVVTSERIARVERHAGALGVQLDALERVGQLVREADLTELRLRLEALESSVRFELVNTWPNGLRAMSTTSNACGHPGCDLEARCECTTCDYAFCREHGLQHRRERCVASDGTPSGAGEHSEET